MAKREAELRVAVEGASGRHALVMFANIVGHDLYFGGPMMGHPMQGSYHESGQNHVHHPGGRSIAPPMVPLQHLKGKHLLHDGSVTMLHTLDWTYRVVPDRKHRRRTLVLELEQLSKLGGVSLWAVEKGRDDLVAEVLARPHFVAVAHALIDWTQPQLLALFWRPSDEVWRVLDAAVRETHGPETRISRVDPTDGTVGPWTLERPPLGPRT